MTVYLDLLILDNFCADAALLYCAVRTVRGEAKLWRLALAALLGTALGVGYTVLCLFYAIPVPVDLILKFGVTLVLPWCALRAKRRRTYALCSLAFLAYMAAFAGLLTALFSGAQPQEGEGTLVYTVAGLPSGVLVLAAVAFAFLAARAGSALARRAKASAQLCTCKLVLGEKSVTVRALIDTGNKLCDKRGCAVPVADPAAVFALFADTLLSARTPCEEIAVTTVSGTSALKTFRIDALEIYCADKTHIIRDVTVALGARPLAGEYGLILPSSFTEEENFARGGKEQC